MIMKKKLLRVGGIVVLGVWVSQACAFVCFQVSHSNSIEACGCTLGKKSPPGTLCGYESWSVADATCDCGTMTCSELETTLTAIKHTCIGTCGQNKCDLIDEDDGVPNSMYHVHVATQCPPQG
jgi:hypothetical protein